MRKNLEFSNNGRFVYVIKNMVCRIFFIAMVLVSFPALHAQELKEGKFGSDGYPVDCNNKYYKTVEEKLLCEVAKKEDISLATFGLSAILLQMVITADFCDFELKNDFYSGFEKIKNLHPKSYAIAVKYATYDSPSDCSKEKIILRDQLK